MSTAVVVQTAWLGDVVLTTPLLDALASRHGPLGVVTTPAAVPLVETHPAVARVHPFDKRGRDRGVRGMRRVAGVLRRERYDVAYHPQTSWRSALVTLLAGVPERVGFQNGPGRWCYTRRVPRDEARPHEADRLLAIAGGRGPSDLSLRLTQTDHAEAERILAQHGVGAPFAVLAPDSARATKRWPYFPDLAVRLAKKMPVVFIGSADPSIRPTVDPPIRRSADLSGLPIRVSAAVIARAAVAVTNDSAPLHLAQAVGTPTVAVFGPTIPALGFGPRGPRDDVVGVTDLACRPCSTHGGARCPLGHHRCMHDLSVETVADVVARVLARLEAPCV